MGASGQDAGAMELARGRRAPGWGRQTRLGVRPAPGAPGPPTGVGGWGGAAPGGGKGTADFSGGGRGWGRGTVKENPPPPPPGPAGREGETPPRPPGGF